VSFDTDASFPKLKFDFGGFLDADTQQEVDKLFGTEEVRQITGELRTAAIPAVPKIASPQQVAPKPAPVVAQPEPAPTPVAEEPAAPKRGFGASKKVATPAPAPQAKATASAPSAASLADEIAALVGEVNADDA
jgi:hypothetical protein